MCISWKNLTLPFLTQQHGNFAPMNMSLVIIVTTVKSYFIIKTSDKRLTCIGSPQISRDDTPDTFSQYWQPQCLSKMACRDGITLHTSFTTPHTQVNHPTYFTEPHTNTTPSSPSILKLEKHHQSYPATKHNHNNLCVQSKFQQHNQWNLTSLIYFLIQFSKSSPLKGRWDVMM